MGQGGPSNLFDPKSYFFCDLKPQANFRNPTITPSGRKVTTSERRKKEEKKKTVNSGHLVPWQRTQAAWTNCSVTARPIMNTVLKLLTKWIISHKMLRIRLALLRKYNCFKSLPIGKFVKILGLKIRLVSETELIRKINTELLNVLVLGLGRRHRFCMSRTKY